MELPTGELEIQFKSGNETKTEKFDLLDLRLMCGELEEKHKLPIVDGVIKPSREFLQDLASQLDSEINGCTSTQAYAVWIQSNDLFQDLKKNIAAMPT